MNVVLPKGDGSKHGDNLKPGEWGVTEDGHVMVRCPHESHSDNLPARFGIIRYNPDDEKRWKIDSQGNVTPSIYFKDDACGWHIFARLEGWKP